MRKAKITVDTPPLLFCFVILCVSLLNPTAGVARLDCSRLFRRRRLMVTGLYPRVESYEQHLTSFRRAQGCRGVRSCHTDPDAATINRLGVDAYYAILIQRLVIAYPYGVYLVEIYG